MEKQYIGWEFNKERKMLNKTVWEWSENILET